MVALLAFAVMLPGCGKKNEQQRTDLILATTTSGAGLRACWTSGSPCSRPPIPTPSSRSRWGSGAAIEMGRSGEADVLLVHSPKDEQKLVDDGFGINRTRIMHNDFIIVGPANDPAGDQGHDQRQGRLREDRRNPVHLHLPR